MLSNKKKYLIILTTLTLLIITTAPVLGNPEILNEALVSGYHEHLFTDVIRHYLGTEYVVSQSSLIVAPATGAKGEIQIQPALSYSSLLENSLILRSGDTEDASRIYSTGGEFPRLILSTAPTRSDIFIGSHGRVGIKTDDPQADLHMHGGTLFELDDDDIFRVYDTDEGRNIIHARGGGFHLSLQPGGGNVGIGTDSPAAKLDVSGKIRSTATVQGDDSSTVTTKGYVDGLIQDIDGSKWIEEQDDHIYRMSDVGIGTASPQEKLDVNGNIILSGTSIREIKAAPSGNRPSIQFHVNDGSTGGDLILRGGGGSVYGNIILGTASSEHVGIGTTNPNDKLTIRGGKVSITNELDHDTLLYVQNNAPVGAQSASYIAKFDWRRDTALSIRADRRVEIASSNNQGSLIVHGDLTVSKQKICYGKPAHPSDIITTLPVPPTWYGDDCAEYVKSIYNTDAFFKLGCLTGTGASLSTNWISVTDTLLSTHLPSDNRCGWAEECIPDTECVPESTGCGIFDDGCQGEYSCTCSANTNCGLTSVDDSFLLKIATTQNMALQTQGTSCITDSPTSCHPLLDIDGVDLNQRGRRFCIPGEFQVHPDGYSISDICAGNIQAPTHGPFTSIHSINNDCKISSLDAGIAPGASCESASSWVEEGVLPVFFSVGTGVYNEPGIFTIQNAQGDFVLSSCVPAEGNGGNGEFQRLPGPVPPEDDGDGGEPPGESIPGPPGGGGDDGSYNYANCVEQCENVALPGSPDYQLCMNYCNSMYDMGQA